MIVIPVVNPISDAYEIGVRVIVCVMPFGINYKYRLVQSQTPQTVPDRPCVCVCVDAGGGVSMRIKIIDARQKPPARTQL